MRMFSAVRAIGIMMAFASIVGAASSAELKKVNIGISSASLPAAAARITKEMGFFEKHGIDAAISWGDNSSITTAGLISGSLDFTTTAPTEVILAVSRGQKHVVVKSLYAGLAGVLVLSKAVAEKLGVSPTAPVPDRLKALNDIVIATPAVTSAFTLSLKPSAEAVGTKIQFTAMSQDAMNASLESGAIQGFMASSPYYGSPVLNGTGVIWISGPKGEFPPQFTAANAVTLNTTQSFAAANPDVVKRMVAAFEDFQVAVKDHPADVKGAIARLFPRIDGRTLDFLYETESAGFRPKPLSEADMAHEIEMLKAIGSPIPQIETLKPADLILR